MNLYNIDEEKLNTLKITSHTIINAEYFWTDERVRKLCLAIQNQKDIQVNLDLFQPRSCTLISDECFKYFGQLQPYNLLELSLNNWGNLNFNISDDAFIHLGNAFKHLKILRLNLNQWGHKGCQISNMGITLLFQAIPQSIVELDLNLNKLGYRNQNMSGFILVVMGDIIKKLTNLQQLTLNIADWGNDYNKSLEQFTDEDLIYLIEKIFTLNLEKLHLDFTGLAISGSKITVESAQYLLQCIQNKEIYDFTVILQGWVVDVNIKNALIDISIKNQKRKKQLYQWQAINSFDCDIQQRMLQKVFEKL